MSNFPATTFIVSGIFILCLATLAAGALIAVLSTRLIRSVCGLAICCLGLAGMYYFLHSPFLALMEILIYIGAVCVTIVFAIMLAEPDEAAESRQHGVLWGTVAVGVSAAIAIGVPPSCDTRSLPYCSRTSRAGPICMTSPRAR